MPNPENLKPFKPGQSGNPDGRPKGSLNRSTIALKWLQLAMKDTNLMTGVEEQLTLEERMTLTMIKKAIDEKDVAAYKAVLDSGYGSPKQTSEVTMTEDVYKLEFTNAQTNTDSAA